MDPTPFIIVGVLMGCGGTLLIQAYGRRKVRKALAAAGGGAEPALRNRRDRKTREDLPSDSETAALARRLAVLEQIVTDKPSALAEQIEGLRRETL